MDEDTSAGELFSMSIFKIKIKSFVVYIITLKHNKRIDGKKRVLQVRYKG